MNYKKYGQDIVEIISNQVLLYDVQSALDWIMSVQYETGCRKVILPKDCVAEDFFMLSTGIAGEILQKFITYQMKLAIVGQYDNYTSKPLHDFIYESNKGKDIFFVNTVAAAVEKLQQAK